MLFTLYLTLAAAQTGLAAAVPRGCQKQARASGQALYLISNEAANSVVALRIGADGLLSAGASTKTGGSGANGIDGSTNQPAAPDALFSQSALTVAGKNIFAVNAKDNTISMLAIDGRDPTKLTMVGKPAAVGGEFPTTVAASTKHGLVCVGSTGAKAGVSCAPFSNNGGVGSFDALRPFDLGQQTPPVGPTNTVSQVFFSEDESALFATVKGDGKPGSNRTGAFAVFPVGGGGGGGGNGAGGCASSSSKAAVAAQGQLTVPAGSAVLFGSQPIPGTGDVFVTDASFGAGIVKLGSGASSSSLVAKTAIDGQKATCWVAISPATKTAFVTDVGVNRLVEMSTADASIVATYDLSADGDPGLIDLKAAGRFVYALSPGNGTTPAAVTVMDVGAGPGKAKMVQHFALGALGAGKNSQGMAVLL